jgi:hypothetical protein
MKNLRKTIPVIIILLAGCTTAKLLMKIDPSLETNARVYEVKSPSSWSDNKKLNVSFGTYRVADANTGWRTTKTSSATEISLANQLLGMSSSDATNIKTSQSLAYKFKIGDEITWDSQCVHLAEKREVKSKNVSSVEILSSQYTCQYTRADNESWTLSIEQGGLSQLDIRMTNKEKLFRAHATAGMYVLSDGRSSKLFAPSDAGYTWTHDNNNVAAISLKEKTPRVWLDKRNPDSMNHVLSMASTGLLIYHWKIAPTLKR